MINLKSKYKLLEKYRDLKFVWPDGAPYAATICGESLHWIEKRQAKKDREHYGWSVVIVPKGLEYSKTNHYYYDYEPIKSENESQLLIAATVQSENIICIDKDKNILDPKAVFEENFDNIPYKKWKEFPDNTCLKIEVPRIEPAKKAKKSKHINSKKFQININYIPYKKWKEFPDKSVITSTY